MHVAKVEVGRKTFGYLFQNAKRSEKRAVNPKP